MTPLDELERLAMAATPGPWDLYKVIGSDGTGVSKQAFANYQYVAAADPQTLLRLIKAVRAAKRWRDDHMYQNRVAANYSGPELEEALEELEHGH